MPVVFIDVHSDAIAGLPRVLGDDIEGGRLAARHLVELGHRDIGFIGDVPENPFGFTSSSDRQRGVATELGHAGMRPAARLDRPWSARPL